MIQLNYRDSRPIYEQVKDGLRQLIINGVLTEGSRLPSVRELARQPDDKPEHDPARLPGA